MGPFKASVAPRNGPTQWGLAGSEVQEENEAAQQCTANGPCSRVWISLDLMTDCRAEGQFCHFLTPEQNILIEMAEKRILRVQSYIKFVDIAFLYWNYIRTCYN